LEDTWRDLRHAVRTLWNTPGFSVVAILVMALAIGANTSLFTVVRSVLMKPLPFRDPDRLIQLYEQSPNGLRAYSYVAGGMYAAWKAQAPSVEQMAIYGTDSINLSGDSGQLPEKIRYAECSWNLFATLGLNPEIGRFFVEAEDHPEAGGTVVITYGLWMRRYGGARAILGKTILLNSRPYTVIGVLPKWFSYPDTRTQLWAPIYHEMPPSAMQAVDDHNFFVVARLKPGATLAQALSEVDTAEKRVHMNHPTPSTGNAANARTLLDGLVHEFKAQLYVLLGATASVLLIACLNVANLLLARSTSRRKEFSIRSALGGSRWRLIRGQVTESVVLAMVAGALGLPLAWMGTHWLVLSRPDLARVDSIRVDGTIALFGLAIAAVSGMLAGLIPAVAFLREPLLTSLQESSRAHSAGSGTARMRKTLLVAEVAITVVLLTSAAAQELPASAFQRSWLRNAKCLDDAVFSTRCALQHSCEGSLVLRTIPSPASRDSRCQGRRHRHCDARSRVWR
jgi:putative ABC transport system permease protein